MMDVFPLLVSFILIAPSGPKGSDRVPPLTDFMRITTPSSNLMEALPSHCCQRRGSFHSLIHQSKCAPIQPRQLGPHVSGSGHIRFLSVPLVTLLLSQPDLTLQPRLHFSLLKKIMKQQKALASSTCYYGNGFTPLEVRHQLEINEILLSKLNYMG